MSAMSTEAKCYSRQWKNAPEGDPGMIKAAVSITDPRVRGLGGHGFFHLGKQWGHQELAQGRALAELGVGSTLLGHGSDVGVPVGPEDRGYFSTFKA